MNELNAALQLCTVASYVLVGLAVLGLGALIALELRS